MTLVSPADGGSSDGGASEGDVFEEHPLLEVGAGRRPAGVRSVVCVVVALVSAWAGALLFRTALPAPFDEVEAKLRQFEARKDAVDVVFVGSSHVHRHVDPDLFDRVAAERGVSVRSHNLGVWGADSFQILYLLRRLRAMKPERLRWVVLDPDLPRLDLPFERGGSPRLVQTHDPVVTWAALQAAWHLEDSVAVRVRAGHLRLDAGLRRLSAWGVGYAAWRRWMTGDEGSPPDAAAEMGGAEGSGYQSLDEAARTRRGARRLTLQRRWEQLHGPATHLAQYRDWYERVQSDDDVPVTDVSSLLSQHLAVCESMGVQTIALTSPTLTRRRWATFDTDRLLATWDLSDLDAVPELFDVSHRFDVSHLNQRGAERMTRHLASEFAELVAPRR